MRANRHDGGAANATRAERGDGMRVNGHCRAAVRASGLAMCAVAFAGIVGCGSLPPSRGEPGRVEPPPVATPQPERAEFAVAASMLDTWNAVGQVLVRLDGVTYESRAQMLGIYAVRYRGERFLVMTRALVIDDSQRGMLTQVRAGWLDGKPNDAVAAVELLRALQQRLPAELARIAAGKR